MNHIYRLLRIFCVPIGMLLAIAVYKLLMTCGTELGLAGFIAVVTFIGTVVGCIGGTLDIDV